MSLFSRPNQPWRLPALAMTATLFFSFFIGCKTPPPKAEPPKIDREYVLDSKMTGYTGVG